jgi:hypothetical protein
MVSPKQTYQRALAILTPDQQARFEAFNLTPVLDTKLAARTLTVPHGKP